ncbi:MAG: protein TolR, partial [Hyphomicrobiales bacterium]|nr:protein TolR [Hyphomicrobiales bacterium]
MGMSAGAAAGGGGRRRRGRGRRHAPMNEINMTPFIDV